jgi:hypothetical protein
VELTLVQVHLQAPEPALALALGKVGSQVLAQGTEHFPALVEGLVLGLVLELELEQAEPQGMVLSLEQGQAL